MHARHDKLHTQSSKNNLMKMSQRPVKVTDENISDFGKKISIARDFLLGDVVCG